MARMRTGMMLLALAVSARAWAQPADSAPQDPYAAPPGQEPVLTEQVAEQLIGRAQELLDAKIFLDAKQLAVEALVKSPKGNAADHARFIIKQVNLALGISDEPEASAATSLPAANDPVDLTPIGDPTQPAPQVEPAPTAPEGQVHDGKLAASIHGGIFGGLIGATVGSFFDSKHPAGGAVPVAIAAGLAGGLFIPKLFESLSWDEAQIRTVGAGSVWGGVVGGLFGDVVTGSNGGQATAQDVLVGASIGSVLGALGGASIANDHKLTRGDIALVDTLAGMGTLGGLTMGMLMQPAQREAYSLNAALGAAGGVVVGLIAAPQTNTTPRRMVRVAGFSLAGGALPFLLYAAIHDPHSTADERVTGALSSVGLLGGAWLGYYLTGDMDVGLDVPDGKPLADAPVSLVGRSSNGSWAFGGVGLSPLSRTLASGLQDQRGLTLSLVGATF